MRTSLILLICLMGASLSYAEERKVNETKSLKELESDENWEKIDNALEELRDLATQITATKKTRCMKAIGNKDFCNCIVEKTPVGLSFLGYVAAVANTKEELSYNSLNEEDRGLVDNARKAREECVPIVWPKIQ